MKPGTGSVKRETHEEFGKRVAKELREEARRVVEEAKIEAKRIRSAASVFDKKRT